MKVSGKRKKWMGKSKDKLYRCFMQVTRSLHGPSLQVSKCPLSGVLLTVSESKNIRGY